MLYISLVLVSRWYPRAYHPREETGLASDAPRDAAVMPVKHQAKGFFPRGWRQVQAAERSRAG